MNRKITIIGAGSVGATVAFMMAVKGIAAEIVMIDINEKKALGEAMDIRQGTAFTAPVKIYAGRYEDAAGSDIVVITSGLGRKPGQTRLDLAKVNVGIMKDIATQISSFDAVICDSTGQIVICSCYPSLCSHIGWHIDPDYMARVLKNGGDVATGVIKGLYSDSRYGLGLHRRCRLKLRCRYRLGIRLYLRLGGRGRDGVAKQRITA